MYIQYCSCSILTARNGGGWFGDWGAPWKGIMPWECGDDGISGALLPPGCTPTCGAAVVLTTWPMARIC